LSASVNHIKQYLDDPKSDYAEDSTKLAEILAMHWDEFHGYDENGMEGYKLLQRMENVSWSPPLLEFMIERHGAVVQGSSRAELHHWVVNFDTMTASIIEINQRQLIPAAASIDVKPIAKKLAADLLKHKNNEVLKWKSDNEVKVEFSKIFKSDSGNKQTVAGRRKRCRNELEKIVEDHGWKHKSLNVFIKK
jgi:hypothetical protein